DDDFPNDMTIKFGEQTLVYKKRAWKIPDEKTGELIEKGLRYGENPDQQAAIFELVSGNLTLGGCQYINPGNGLVSSIAEADMIQAGKHPGKTNLTDLDNGLNIMKYLMNKPAAVILKHNNPCGAAYADSVSEAYEKANMADRIAAFGGCLVVNRPMDKKTAEAVNNNYLEVVAAPDFEEGVVPILAKRKNLRIIRVKKINELAKYRDFRFVEFKSLIDGGLIAQQSQLSRIRTKDDFLPSKAVYKGREYATERMPSDKEYEDMIFGWSVEMGITSNSVIYVKNGETVGIGTGEQDRVGVAEIAVFKAYTKYSDAICFKNYGVPYKTLELQAARGERDAGLLEEIDMET
ncbi:MAG: IMP cyclohydrolase, partial [Nitrospirae bacterium]|nr:IMP cyclohydrolase [Nitrospirota bacterium]